VFGEPETGVSWVYAPTLRHPGRLDDGRGPYPVNTPPRAQLFQSVACPWVGHIHTCSVRAGVQRMGLVAIFLHQSELLYTYAEPLPGGV